MRRCRDFSRWAGMGADGAAAMARQPCRRRRRRGTGAARGQPGRAAKPAPRTSVPVPRPWRPSGGGRGAAGQNQDLNAAASGVGRAVAGGRRYQVVGRACRPRCRRTPARASRDDLQAEGLGQPVAPVVPPAGAEIVPGGTGRSRRCAERHGGGHGLRGQSVTPPPPSRPRCQCVSGRRGITAYLPNGETLEHAQQIAGHASPRTTKLYGRTADTGARHTPLSALSRRGSTCLACRSTRSLVTVRAATLERPQPTAPAAPSPPAGKCVAWRRSAAGANGPCFPSGPWTQRSREDCIQWSTSPPPSSPWA